MLGLKSIKIPATFFVIGMCWAFYSDPAITFLTRHLDAAHQDVFRSLNDFVFVILISLILYYQIRSQGKELSKSEAEYRGLFEFNPNPMWIYDKKTLRFVNVNKVAIEKYKHSKKTFLKMTINDMHPANEIEKVHNYIKNNYSTSINEAPTWKHVIQSGELIDVSIASHDITFKDKPCRLVMATDITAILLKENELKIAYDKIKIQNKALIKIAWSNSHELRRPLCSVLSLTNMLRDDSIEKAERLEYLNLLESCTIELDELMQKNNAEIETLNIDRTQ